MYALIYERYPGNIVILEYGSLQDCIQYKAVLDEALAEEAEIVLAWKNEEGNIEW